MKKISLITPHMLGNELEYVKDAFNTNWLAPLGPYVNKFEDKIKEYIDIEGAVALSSGTASIHLALKSLGIKKGDIVFCSDLTFIASANPIVYEGAIPVFIDSEEETGNMCPKALEKAFSKYKPKAVIVVQVYGAIANIDEIKAICDKHGTPIIEDSTEALGSTYKGQHAGTFGECGCFSFNGNKIITTTGGGMLVAHNKEVIDKAFKYATQSREAGRYYLHNDIGYNYRLSNVSAAIGLGQLETIDKKIALKKHINDKYKEGLKDIKELEIFDYDKDRINNHWISCLKINSDKITPENILVALEVNDIESRFFWKPLHTQPVFKDNDYIKVNDESISEKLFNTCLCLPSDTNMTDEEQDKIIDIIKEVSISVCR